MANQDSTQQASNQSIINQDALGNAFSKHVPVPYLALVTTQIVLILAIVFNLIGLSVAGVAKLVSDGGVSLMSIFGGSAIKSAIFSQVATLIVAFLALTVVNRLVSKAEADESWRLTQKARRVLYTIGIVILVLTMLAGAISLVQGLLAAGAASNPGTAVLNTLLVSTLIIAIADCGLYVLANIYAGRNSAMVKRTLTIMAVLAVIFSAYGLYQAYNTSSSTTDTLKSLYERSSSPSSSSSSRSSSSSSSSFNW